MKCGFDKDQLSWLLTDDNLSEKERTRLENHLATCSDCREEFMMIRNMWEHTTELPAPEPSPALELGFHALLNQYKRAEAETRQLQRVGPFEWIKQLWTIQPRFQLAYSIIILAVGLTAGVIWNNSKNTGNTDVQALSSQVTEMKEMLMLSLLENPSASERMKAVSFVSEENDVNRKVADALLTTLNNDENVNVRLSTLEALSNFANDPVVRQGLIASIIKQDSPLVQAALADVMVKLQEKKAVKPLQKILQSEETNEIIKTKIRESIHKLS